MNQTPAKPKDGRPKLVSRPSFITDCFRRAFDCFIRVYRSFSILVAGHTEIKRQVVQKLDRHVLVQAYSWIYHSMGLPGFLTLTRNKTGVDISLNNYII